MKIVSAAIIAGIVGLASLPPPSAEAAAYRENVLHSFGSGTDGQYPSALIDVKGKLYGTTSGGGTGSGCSAYGCGTAFVIDRKTRVETVLYSFCTQKNCADGESPSSGLIRLDGKFYGTTFLGGSGFAGVGSGTAFSLDPNTGQETVLYSFCQQQNCPDGSYATSLIAEAGTLYGTTETGGTGYHGQGLGTAFTLDPNSGHEHVLYSFCQDQSCSDGQNPNPAMIDVDGTLYGTTVSGGAYGCGNGQGCGTVFSLDPTTGVETVIHSFGNGHDGRIPQASLIAANGLLYGTTYGGGVIGCGAFGCGTVYSIDPSTGTETVLYAFCSQQKCSDGANPNASLIFINGILYGTTSAGGRAGCSNTGCGTVFSVDPGSGAETVLYSFCKKQNCTDGSAPYANLTGAKGLLYGTTYGGGAYGYGTAFALKEKR